MWLFLSVTDQQSDTSLFHLFLSEFKLANDESVSM